jgi:AraC family transcriptional regulator of adaptative response/methylated-DNA-[protein]-cysteine methyltransferase
MHDRTAATRRDRSRDFERIARAIEYIAVHAHEQPSLPAIAAAAGWSEYHFARVFRRWAGISPKQFLQHLSLSAAKQTLDDERSVLQAALDAGLSGPGRLHDLFVALEAVTPGEYKSRGRDLVMRHGTADTPFGPARIALTERGIAYLAFADAESEFDGWEAFRRTWREADWQADDRAAASVATTIWRTTPGVTRKLSLWLHGSNFQLQVWRALLAAGARSTTTYATLAREVGQPSACRAVGAAVGSNPVAWLIPCHHVLRANGALSGYRWGPARKRAMLAWELAQSLRDASRPRRASPPSRASTASARSASTPASSRALRGSIA